MANTPSTNHCLETGKPCSLCCKLIGVAPLKKPRYQWCSHCTSTGCGIYADRPEDCKDFECIWLATQVTKSPLPKELKPSICGAIIGGTVDGKQMVVHLNDGTDWRKGTLGQFIKFTSAHTDVIIRHRYHILVIAGNRIVGEDTDLAVTPENHIGHYEVTLFPPEQWVKAVP